MIELKKAIKLAEAYFEENGIDEAEVGNIYETPESWIMFPDYKGKFVVGGFGVQVMKKQGETRLFAIPSEENFAILDSAVHIQG